MKKYLKMLPYLAVNILGFYLLPLLMRDTGGAMLILLTVLPAMVSVVSFLYGYINRCIGVLYCLITAAVFVPVIFIYMNYTAWMYAPAYFVVALIFNVLGKAVWKLSVDKQNGNS